MVCFINGKPYKNNYLNHVDAAKLYKKDFGEVYKMFAEGGPLEQYMNQALYILSVYLFFFLIILFFVIPRKQE